MSASRLVDQLEKHRMVSEKVIRQLRKQITADRDARSVAKLLVRRGLLTEAQAQQALTAAAAQAADPDEELGLVLLDDSDLLESDAPARAAAEDLLEPDVRAPRAEVEPKVERAGLAELTSPSLLDDTLEQETWSESEFIPSGRRQKSGWWERLRGRDRRPTNRWDSPLLLWGGGALVALVVLAVGLSLFLFQGSGDELITAADEAYRGQEYLRAIEIYNQFLDGYSAHEGAGLARTRRGLAEIRNATDLQKDWPQALRVAQRVLPKLEQENALQDAHAELADLLPRLLGGLVDLAARAKTPAEARGHIEQADQVVELINNPAYLPSSRHEAKEDQIQELLSRRDAVVRQISRDEKLAETIAQMDQLASQGDVVRAYQAGYELVREYPVLNTNRPLAEAFHKITDQERRLIVPLENPPAPRPAQPNEPPGGNALPTFDMRGEPAEDLPRDLILPLLAQGSVYAIQASTGQVMWRHFVGYETTADPQRVAADLVVATDQQHNVVTAVELTSGQARWELQCPSRPFAPLVAGNSLLVSCEQGELLQVDTATGQVRRAIRFPLPLATGAAWDSQSGRIYQPAAYASLYQLDADSLECLSVYPLGHRQSSLAVPPIVVEGVVVAAENTALDRARLHILSPDSDGKLKPAAESAPLLGQVTSAMRVEGTRVAVVTDRGSVRVIDARPPGGDSQPRALVDLTGSSRQPQSHFIQLQGSRLWIAGPGLVSYEIVASQGRLSKEGVYLIDETVMAPLQQWAGYLFILSADRTGSIRLTAQNISTARSQWSTRLAGVPAGPLQVLDQGTLWITTGGAFYRLRDQQFDELSSLAPERIVPLEASPLGGSVLVSENRLLVYESLPTQKLWLIDPASQGVTPMDLATDGQAMTAPPAWGSGGLAVPTTRAIHLIDPVAGQAVATPFQPRLAILQEAGWTSPAWIPDQPQLVVADAQGRLFRLQVVAADGSQYLHLEKQTQLPGQPVAPPAASSESVWVAVEQDDQAKILVLGAQELTPVESWPLPALPAWGPEVVGPSVMLADQSGRLWNWDLNGKLLWQQPLEGQLAGRPWWDGTHWMCTVHDGRLLRLDPQTGHVEVQAEADEPLASGPAPVNTWLVACLANGGIYAFAGKASQ